MTRRFWITTIISGIIVAMTLLAVIMGRDPHTAAQANPFGAGWQQERAAFVQEYEAKHGEIDNATETWLFSNAHRMCWWLAAEPRLPSEALTYGTTDLEMSADQTITVTEAAIGIIEDCPDYNPHN